ncbi:MAG: hypothetical protein WCI36_02085 [bacterium]
MNLFNAFNKVFPGIENKNKYPVDSGRTTSTSNNMMRSLEIKNLDEEIVETEPTKIEAPVVQDSFVVTEAEAPVAQDSIEIVENESPASQEPVETFEIEKKENSQMFEKSIERVDKIKSYRIARVQRGEKGIELIKEVHLSDVKLEELSAEEKEKLTSHLDRANSEIKKAQVELAKSKEVEKSATDTVELPIEKPVEFAEILNLENDENIDSVIVKNFRDAASKIEKSKLSKEKFEKKFKTKLMIEVEGGDFAERLIKCADIIEHYHEDVVSPEEHKYFWNGFSDYKNAVDRINDESYSKKMVVVEGRTYIVNREAKNEEIPAAIEKFEMPKVQSEHFEENLVSAIDLIEEISDKKSQVNLADGEIFLEKNIKNEMENLLNKRGFLGDGKPENDEEEYWSKLQELNKSAKKIAGLQKKGKVCVVQNDKTYFIKKSQEISFDELEKTTKKVIGEKYMNSFISVIKPDYDEYLASLIENPKWAQLSDEEKDKLKEKGVVFYVEAVLNENGKEVEKKVRENIYKYAFTILNK